MMRVFRAKPARFLCRGVLVLTTLFGAGHAFAMTFSIGPTIDGLRGVNASGEIIPGDARRLLAALAMADEDASGSRRLYLDSPGGSVSEALGMAQVLDRMKVTTVVRTGAACASACAEVVFISGSRNVLEYGALLGFHTCYTRASRGPLPECNTAIADNAAAHGVDWGTAIVFLRAAGPSEMVWVGKALAECWGLADPRLQARLASVHPYIPPCVAMLTSRTTAGAESASR
jgi:hypothetical protein